MDAAQPRSIVREDMITVFKESNNLSFFHHPDTVEKTERF